MKKGCVTGDGLKPICLSGRLPHCVGAASAWPAVVTVRGAEREKEEKERARDGERAGGGRMGDGLGGGRAGITIKQPLTAHTTPEQLTEELQRQRGGGGWGGEGCG